MISARNVWMGIDFGMMDFSIQGFSQKCLSGGIQKGLGGQPSGVPSPGEKIRFSNSSA